MNKKPVAVSCGDANAAPHLLCLIPKSIKNRKTRYLPAKHGPYNKLNDGLLRNVAAHSSFPYKGTRTCHAERWPSPTSDFPFS